MPSAPAFDVTPPKDVAIRWLRRGRQIVHIVVIQLEGERLEILEALPPSFGNPRYPSQEEAMALGYEFSRVARFAERPPAAALRQSLSLLDAMQSERVLYRLKEIGTTIRSACEIWGRDYDPSRTFAVNHRWGRRWETLLCGGVFLAYIGMVEFPSST